MSSFHALQKQIDVTVGCILVVVTLSFIVVDVFVIFELSYVFFFVFELISIRVFYFCSMFCVSLYCLVFFFLSDSGKLRADDTVSQK